MYRYVFFDLDGTLLDTISDIARALNKTLEEQGYRLKYDSEAMKKLIGSGAEVLVRRALAPLDLKEEQIIAFGEKFRDYYLLYQGETTVAFPGVIKLLETLKKRNVKTFVCTNKPHNLAVDIIAQKFPGLFNAVYGLNDGETQKPDPYLLKKIADENGILRKDEILFVGDSKSDVFAAKNFGVDCALMRYGYEDYRDIEITSNAKYLLDRADDLLKIILNND